MKGLSPAVRLILLLAVMFMVQAYGLMVLWSGICFEAHCGDQSKLDFGALLFFGAPVVAVIFYLKVLRHSKEKQDGSKVIPVIILIALAIPVILVANGLIASWHRHQLEQDSKAARERFERSNELYRVRHD
jgi:1,4-dihydroxy-2-naphthoate octaprenyltransferase